MSQGAYEDVEPGPERVIASLRAHLDKIHTALDPEADDDIPVEVLIALAVKVREERDELQQLIDLQHTRTQKADKLWQEATGKHDRLPDLGVLIDWLLERKESQK